MGFEEPDQIIYKERLNINRVTVIPEFTCGKNKYLLFLHNTSRKEWELPGGEALNNESVTQTALREINEELGQPKITFSFSETDREKYSTFTELDLFLGKAKTKKGKGIIVRPVIATVALNDLPGSFPLSSEHDDYLFVRIPNEWGENQRRDYLALLTQFDQCRLIFSVKPHNHLAILELTNNIVEIKHHRKNISLVSGAALKAYLQTVF